MLWKLTDNIKYEECEVRASSLTSHILHTHFQLPQPHFFSSEAQKAWGILITIQANTPYYHYDQVLHRLCIGISNCAFLSSKYNRSTLIYYNMMTGFALVYFQTYDCRIIMYTWCISVLLSSNEVHVFLYRVHFISSNNSHNQRDFSLLPQACAVLLHKHTQVCVERQASPAL